MPLGPKNANVDPTIVYLMNANQPCSLVLNEPVNPEPLSSIIQYQHKGWGIQVLLSGGRGLKILQIV